MRKITIEEMELVAGGGVSLGDISLLSGNGIASGNSISICGIANGNSIANDTLNHSLNGTGALNGSFND